MNFIEMLQAENCSAPASNEILNMWLDEFRSELWPDFFGCEAAIPAKLHDSLRWQQNQRGIFAVVNPISN